MDDHWHLRHLEGGRRLSAARTVKPCATVAVHSGGQRCSGGSDGEQAPRKAYRADDRAGRRRSLHRFGGRPRLLQPTIRLGVCDLHLRLYRQAQRGHDRAWCVGESHGMDASRVPDWVKGCHLAKNSVHVRCLRLGDVLVVDGRGKSLLPRGWRNFHKRSWKPPKRNR